MAQLCQQPLAESPFTTYRDPYTGKWVVQKNQNTTTTNYFNLNTNSPFNLSSLMG